MKRKRLLISVCMIMVLALGLGMTVYAGTINFDITVDGNGNNPDPYSYKELKDNDGDNYCYVTTTWYNTDIGWIYTWSEDTQDTSVKSYEMKCNLHRGSVEERYSNTYKKKAYGGHLYRMNSRYGSANYILVNVRGRYCP